MLTRYLIIAAAAFSVGFGTGTYWQSLLRSLDTARRDSADAKQVSASHVAGAILADTINTIETNASKEIAHATTETNDIGSDLAAGAVGLRLNGTCPPIGETSAGARVVDGAGAGRDAASGQSRPGDARPQLNRSAEPDYLALRIALKRCPAKVAGLQAILKEERRVGTAE